MFSQTFASVSMTRKKTQESFLFLLRTVPTNAEVFLRGL